LCSHRSEFWVSIFNSRTFESNAFSRMGKYASVCTAVTSGSWDDLPRPRSCTPKRSHPWTALLLSALSILVSCPSCNFESLFVVVYHSYIVQLGSSTSTPSVSRSTGRRSRRRGTASRRREKVWCTLSKNCQFLCQLRWILIFGKTKS
jgi:hypothetical protein